MAATYTTVETPTARKVPRGRLRAGFFRSPDMLTPCVKPVTAGKKIAKTTQNPGPSTADPQLSLSTLGLQLASAPAKNDTNAAISVPMMTN